MSCSLQTMLISANMPMSKLDFFLEEGHSLGLPSQAWLRIAILIHLVFDVPHLHRNHPSKSWHVSSPRYLPWIDLQPQEPTPSAIPTPSLSLRVPSDTLLSLKSDPKI